MKNFITVRGIRISPEKEKMSKIYLIDIEDIKICEEYYDVFDKEVVTLLVTKENGEFYIKEQIKTIKSLISETIKR